MRFGLSYARFGGCLGVRRGSSASTPASRLSLTQRCSKPNPLLDRRAGYPTQADTSPSDDPAVGPARSHGLDAGALCAENRPVRTAVVQGNRHSTQAEALRRLALECVWYVARTRRDLPGHWRLVRWLNGHQQSLRRLPARSRSLGRGAKLFVDPADYDGLRYLLHGITEGDPLTALLKRLLRPGDTFVDVGANVGMYSVVASLCVGTRGRVLALEASPATFEKLQVITQHGLGNVVAKHCAVADAAGSLDFFIGPEDHSGVSSLRDLGAAATKRVSVPADTLDHLLEGWPRVRFVKIDVEGAEFGVIRGALRTLEQDRPYLAMELTPKFLASFGLSLEELLAAILRLGYRCRRLKPLFPEFNGLGGDEFQCDVVFVPVELDQSFPEPLRSDASRLPATGEATGAA